MMIDATELDSIASVLATFLQTGVVVYLALIYDRLQRLEHEGKEFRSTMNALKTEVDLLAAKHEKLDRLTEILSH